jgi:uncharacterized protein YdiU (UPF0061 family)
MARKLGFITPAEPNKDTLEQYEYDLIESLFTVMQETSADFTNTFRSLAHICRDPAFTEGDKRVLDLIVN